LTESEIEQRLIYERRRVNLIWECTQAIIAASVTGVTLYASVLLSFRGSGEAAYLLLSNAFFLVLGLYFRGTNGQKTFRPISDEKENK
jgi:hypothetical protein